MNSIHASAFPSLIVLYFVVALGAAAIITVVFYGLRVVSDKPAVSARTQLLGFAAFLAAALVLPGMIYTAASAGNVRITVPVPSQAWVAWGAILTAAVVIAFFAYKCLRSMRSSNT